MANLSKNAQGILWMILSMAGFAAEDALIKASGQNLPIAQVLCLFGFGGMLIFGASALISGQRLFVPEVISRPMFIRAGFEVMGRLFYTLAIVLAPLTIVTVILQATPLVVVASAAILFHENVGWRRWVAIGLGFVGVVIVMQPGSDRFTVFTLFAILGLFGFAGRDLASRAAPATLSTSQLGIYGFLALIVAGVIYSIWEQAPFVWLDGSTFLYMMGAVTFGVIGYAALMRAMRTGEVSAVTPFRYSRLLFGVALGVIFFGEVLTANILVGSILILAAGLFIIWRGNASK
ncbi:MAG: DMT family transporter [Pseudomonadota bacterium]